MILHGIRGFESLPLRQVLCQLYGCGEVSEWPKEHAWKACVGVTPPRVRIPPSPPHSYSEPGMELGPCASSSFEPCQARKGAALRGNATSAAGCLGSMTGSYFSVTGAQARRDSPSPASGRKPTTLPLGDPHGNGHGWLLRVSSNPHALTGKGF